MINLNETIATIKKVGPSKTRIIPMDGENALTGKCQIQILESGGWDTIVLGIPRNIAENIVSQATNRVILG